MVAAVISGIVAANRTTAGDGTITRGVLVVGALAITSFVRRSGVSPRLSRARRVMSRGA
jgi:hypothetical protein